MARFRSSGKSTPPRSLHENVSRTQTLPPKWVVGNESCDDPMNISDDDQIDLMDDSSDDPKQNVPQTTTTALMVEGVEMVATSPSPPSRKERTRSTRKKTVAPSDTAHIPSKQHQEATVDDDLEVDQEPPSKSRPQQTRIEQAIDIPTRAENDEASSPQSSTGPETSSHSSGSKEADQNPPTTDLNEIISGMSEAIKKGLSEKEKKDAGRVYFLENTSGETSSFKIGSTGQKVEVRVNAQIRKCRLKGTWKHRSYPDFPLRGYIHLEKISQKELSYMRISFHCPCNTDHCEYFDGEKEIARRTIQFWARWLKACQPYDNDGSLLPFWTARLDYFEHKTDHYFRCLEPSCRRPSACQACLRAGWKAWTEPTTRDQIKFWMWSSIAIPNICFHLIGCLTTVSLFLSPIPLSVIVTLTGWLRQLEISIIILTYLWIYKEGILKYIAAPSDKPKSNQQAQKRQPTTPEKQPETVQIPHTAPARLPDIASITNYPQDQIPNTAPIQTKRTRSERYLIPEESPSKAAQRRRRASKSPTPPSETDIEEARKRSVDEPKQDGVGGAVVEG